MATSSAMVVTDIFSQETFAPFFLSRKKCIFGEGGSLFVVVVATNLFVDCNQLNCRLQPIYL
jgi:hypothetical protein